jgi:2-desacetyl-2-hydroxyethyl bacteriochlorophyllide A dehydrogenase
MRNLVFKAPWTVALEEGADPSGETLIKNEASVVSPGTELAILSGGESWAPLPYVPGYGSVGRVLRAGGDCARRGIKEGDRVFTYGKHAELVEPECVCVPVPDGLAPERAAFARMAAVSITAIRCSEIELGDSVLVFGAGLVGIFAAQLARMSGASVAIVDPEPRRLQAAEACGVRKTARPHAGLYEELRSSTGGSLFSTVIEATGSPAVAEEAIRFVGRRGEMILLGSPRGERETDITPFLNRVHLCPDVVTLKGAHEWRYPTRRDPEGFSKHSIEGNVEMLLEALRSGELLVEPLLTRVARPSSCQEVYSGLRTDRNTNLGIAFDWTAR